MDASVLDGNINKARDTVKNKIFKKMTTIRLQKLLSKTDEPRKLYSDLIQMKLDIDKDDQFLKFVEKMEKFLDLLGLLKIKL